MATATTNPTQQSSRSRKKKAKSEAPAQSAPPPPEADAGNGSTDAITNGADGVYESPYIKELYKYTTLYDYTPTRTNNCAFAETSAM